MVRAILSGAKTQTRRVCTTREPLQFIGGRGEEGDPDKWGWFFDGPDHHGYMVLGRGHDERHDHGRTSIPCPFGEPGDRLWCKETHSTDALTVYPCPPVWYRADCGMYDDPASGEHGRSCDALRTGHPRADCYVCAMNGRRFRWRPSIFMPRKLSRITLEIAEVRVQRLAEISEDDARAEGVRISDAATAKQDSVDTHGMTPYRAAFACLWDSINGQPRPMLDDDGDPVLDDNGRPIMVASRSWASNPWIWALTFRRLP